MNVELCRHALFSGGSCKRPDDSSRSNDELTPTPTSSKTPAQKEFQRLMLSSLCNIPLEQVDEDAEPIGLLPFGVRANSPSTMNPFSLDSIRALQHGDGLENAARTISKANEIRKLPKSAYLVLDAPDLVNDFFLDLVSWGQESLLAVALANSVYLLNAETQAVTRLATLYGRGQYVTSISWCTIPGASGYLAIGTSMDIIEIWDTNTLQKIRTLEGHEGGVSSLTWNQHWLTSGGFDGSIKQHDLGAPESVVSTYQFHNQPVCGLKWDRRGTTLASGGNEGRICLWDSAMSFSRRHPFESSISATMAPRLVLSGHLAAVKALDWCPTSHDLLASGGGLSDRTIKFWNTSTGAALNSVNTGSQVSSVMWSKHRQELLSAQGHGDLTLWRHCGGSNLKKVKDFKGHSKRVLGLVCSPDGSTVVSVGADETIRFWNIFDAPSHTRSSILSIGGDATFGMPQIR